MNPIDVPTERPHIHCKIGLGTTLLFGAICASAQSGGGYDLHWNTQDTGGNALSGASGYTLAGTVAQADAGAPTSGANGYSLRGGFWPGVHEANDVIFQNGFEMP